MGSIEEKKNNNELIRTAKDTIFVDLFAYKEVNLGNL